MKLRKGANNQTKISGRETDRALDLDRRNGAKLAWERGQSGTQGVLREGRGGAHRGQVPKNRPTSKRGGAKREWRHLNPSGAASGDR